MLVEQSSDGVQVAERQQPAVVEYDDLLGDALDLLEDMARDDNCHPGSSLLFDQQDLADPTESKLFRELCSYYDDRLSKRALRLRDAAAAESVTEANRILGSFRSPKPLPSDPFTIHMLFSPLGGYVPPRSRMAPTTRRASLPMRIPDIMRREGDVE